MGQNQIQKQVAHKLPLVSRSWRQLADDALAEHRVSNSMAWCLIHLDRLGPQSRQTELAQAIGITPSTAVRVLDQLENAGLIERALDPDDKRSRLISLSPAGRELVGKIEARLADLRGELFHDVPEGDIETTLRVLETLSRRLAERRA